MAEVKAPPAGFKTELVIESPPPIVVTGKVTNEKGEALEGASVTIKGTTQGVTVGQDGKFSIEVPSANTVLVISSVGHLTQEISLKGKTVLQITLKEKPTSLTDIIVVGYGTQRKTDVTGSIASVNEQQIKSVPVSNLISAMQGQAPGLDIQKGGGYSHPGATPSISIRGRRSLGATNDVLYIVDGIPFSSSYINDLNPDDVVSIQILKDASATAIYGARGANGVILITTRRGKPGKPVITYNAYAGPQQRLGVYDEMNGPQYEVYKKWAIYNGANPSTPNTPNPYNGIDDPKFYTDGLTFLPAELTAIKNHTSTDWQKLIYSNGFKTNHQVSISGGSESTQYSISAGYYNEKGIFASQSFRRYSIKVTIDQQLSKMFRAGISSLNSVSNINGEGINPISQALQSSPLTVPYDASGNLIPFPAGGSLVYNPLANLVPGAVIQNRQRFNTFTTVYLEAQLLPHLKYRFNGGIELTPETYGAFYGSATYQNLSGPSTATNTSYNYHDYTLENLLVYDNTFAKDHHVTATGLFSYQEDYKTSTSFSYNNILANDIQYYNPSLGANLSGGGSYSKFNIVSFMGRLNYSYKGKYLLTGTLRSDGSSTLAPGNKYHIFPSVALGWNIMNEAFFKDHTLMSNLKLRAGYGTVGNAAINPYQTLGGLTSISYNYGSSNVTGTYPNNIPNPNLGWENTASVNVGVDFGFLNDRITGTIDLYHQYTSDLILPQNLPITSGYTQQFFINVGKTENKGMEIGITSTNIRAATRRNFGWVTNLNISFNRNKITALQAGVKNDIGSLRFVGSSINSIYNYVREGVWQNTPDDSALAKKMSLTLTGAGSVIGTIKVKDLDNNNIINSNDRTIVGTYDPKFQGGITNRFSYMGFDLVVVASYRVGGTLVASQFQSGSSVLTFDGKRGMLNVNYWTPTNHENYYPKPNFNSLGAAYGDLLGYFDASYLKIRTLSLGYTLAPKLTDKMGIKSLRAYVSLNDAIILFSPFVNKYHGIDPESSGTLGVDTPPMKSLLFGLNVSF